MSILYSAFRSELLKLANGDEDTKGPAPSEAQVIQFLDKNPRPSDKQFHAWAESQGFNKHKAEQVTYGILSDLINKGRSKGKAPAGIAPKDAKEGVRIEAEHTPNKLLQRKIVNDHNTELSKYYDKKEGLPAMEKSLDKKASYAAFRLELLKIAEDEGLFPTLEEDPGPDAIQTPQDSGIEEPASTPGPPLREDDSGAADSVGDLASMDARRALQGMLKDDAGKRAIREAFNKLDRSSREVSTLKSALTRGLLRARREIYGPARDPVQNLNEILEGNIFAPQPS